jgi:hypothetical protein
MPGFRILIAQRVGWKIMAIGENAEAGSGSRPVVRIFQSYGWHDATRVSERLKASLAEAGYEVWLDREQLRQDDKHFGLALQEAIDNSEVVVALLSPHSVRLGTGEDRRVSICYNELLTAEHLQRPIVPVRVQKFPGGPPFLIIKYRRIDWLDWDDPDAYRKGVGDIVGTIERVRKGDRNLDRDIDYQASNFTAELETARDDFVGRDWLFSRLDAWLAADKRCFLIEGATGSGKTALAAELVRRNPGGRILAYHFCTTVPVTRDAMAFVRSLAGMLAAGIDAYGELLWNSKLAAWLSASDPLTMLREGVLAPLGEQRMDTTYYIVVDALDEALGTGDDSAELSLPQLLSVTIDKFPSWLKLLVTTRPHARIQRLFSTAETCGLGGTVGDQRMDLRAYIEHGLGDEALRDAVGGDPAARERALARIEERSAGSFQYAGSILDALRRREIGLAELDRLPRSLEEFYYNRADLRFRKSASFRVPRLVLTLLVAAREPLTLRQLALFAGLDIDGDVLPAIDALTGFVSPELGAGEDVYRLAHASVTDWLLSSRAGQFMIDPQPGRERILAHCREWRTHDEPYALKHAISHLLEEGQLAEARQAVAQGLFTDRLGRLKEPRLDAEDSRNLTLALVGARDKAGILALARTENTWQRDGVAAGLQSTPPSDAGFLDEVVAALLALKE